MESLSYQKNLDSSIVSAPSVQNQFSSCRFQVFEHFRVNSPKSTEGLSDQQEATLTRKYWHFVSCAWWLPNFFKKKDLWDGYVPILGGSWTITFPVQNLELVNSKQEEEKRMEGGKGWGQWEKENKTPAVLGTKHQTGNCVAHPAFITVKRRFHSLGAVESLSQIFIFGEERLLLSMKTGAWLDVQLVYWLVLGALLSLWHWMEWIRDEIHKISPRVMKYERSVGLGSVFPVDTRGRSLVARHTPCTDH